MKLKFKKGTGKIVEKYDDVKEKKGKKKKILVTGGAGFLGYHISQRMRYNYDLVFLDIADFIVDEYPKDSKLYNCDVRNKKMLEEIIKVEEPDHIIHAAAALPLWKPKDIFSTNVNGTKNVFDLAYEYGIERTVFISSTAVYGVPKVHPLYEDSPLIGVGPYGESKIKAEKIIMNKFWDKMIGPIIRPKTFIGTARLGVFQILYEWVEEGRRIPVIGNGKNRYQLLEVDDLVDAIVLTIEKPKSKVNDVFNVGAEKFGTVEEDLNALFKHARTGSRILPTPAWLVKPILAFFEAIGVSPLYKWVYGTADKDSFVSVEKIKKRLGWKARYSNAEALIRSYDWFIEHKDEITKEGVTHRVKWNEGILGIIRKFM